MRLLAAVLLIGAAAYTAAVIYASPSVTRLSPPHHPAAVTPPGEG